ncbi:GatB/YqeY domain-containing protein [Rickettsiella grylli]|uniref:GatB/YqeY domain-containing protein n=1 Tax=Rickettsiella grylli TaxID=59196 RepID=UPI0009F809F0|nr:GatB/YqeY domain-containing protein [Rickettsiella grylli]
MMMATLKQRIQEDTKTALRTQDKQRLNVMRLISAEIKQVEVDERIEVDDKRITQILNKMIKQRRDSIQQFGKAKRDDLAEQERLEVNVIQMYLPEPLSEADIDRLLSESITKVGATSVKDMGKIMAELKERIQGRADMTQISKKIKERLT